MAHISHKRHIAKAFTWRLVGSVDTFLIAWFISGDSQVGLKIGLIETVTKILLYYGHERLWYQSAVKESVKRHLYKTVSWRILGTLDTILIGWFISGDPFMGLSIGAVEIVTKMILYYFHERIWYKLDYGVQGRHKHKNE